MKDSLPGWNSLKQLKDLPPWAGIVLIVLIALLKLAALIHYGPYLPSDSGNNPMGYLTYARLLLDEGPMLPEAELPAVVFFRTCGFPALLALSITLFGENYQWALAALQSMGTLWMITLLYIITHRITHSVAWSCLAALIYAFSPSFQFDLFIQTDTLYAALVSTIYLYYFSKAIQGSPPSYMGTIIVSLGLIVATLLREFTLILSLLLLPLFFLIRRATPETESFPMLRHLALLYLSLALTVGSIVLWNKHLTGTAFLAGGGQTAFFYPLARMGMKEPHRLRPDEILIDRLIMERIEKMRTETHWRKNQMDDVIVQYTRGALLDKGWHYLEIHDAAKKRYLQMAFEHPGFLIREAFSEWFPRGIGAVFTPLLNVERLDQYILGIPRQPIITSYSGLNKALWIDSTLSEKLILIGRFVPLGIALLLFLLYIPGFPIVAWRAWKRKESAHTQLILSLGAIWIFYIGFLGLYSPINYETRYTLPALPALILCALFSARYLLFNRRTLSRKPS
ncbi:MAG: hypothetical protein HQL50_15695 [Magnetococcales bacterium]|nr:hypothetical protein [Magnetococcales bacterium]